MCIGLLKKGGKIGGMMTDDQMVDAGNETLEVTRDMDGPF